MTFVSVPNSGQSLGQTRDQIRTNMDDLRTCIAVDHYDTNVSDRGKHAVSHWPEQTTFPTTPANEGAVYAREYNSRTELAFKPESTADTADYFLLTGMPIRAAARFDGSGANGAMTLIGRSFNITSITKSGATNGRTYSVVFTTQFPVGAASANYLVIPFIARNGSSLTSFEYSINNIAVGGFDLNIQLHSEASFVSFIVLGG